MMSTIDWDINDNRIPNISHLDEYEEWSNGHTKHVYRTDCEEAKRHSSGWAMRNTNNHNVNILKKSCLGVLVCSLRCTMDNGNQVHMRPAICDKARKKQQGKPCPNRKCIGHLEILSCRGHCGYPVTHFWRHTKFAIFFQGKGYHDHPQPEAKSTAESRRSLHLTAASHNSGRPAKRRTSHSNKYTYLLKRNEMDTKNDIFVSPPKVQRFVPSNYYRDSGCATFEPLTETNIGPKSQLQLTEIIQKSENDAACDQLSSIEFTLDESSEGQSKPENYQFHWDNSTELWLDGLKMEQWYTDRENVTVSEPIPPQWSNNFEIDPQHYRSESISDNYHEMSQSCLDTNQSSSMEDFQMFNPADILSLDQPHHYENIDGEIDDQFLGNNQSQQRFLSSLDSILYDYKNVDASMFDANSYKDDYPQTIPTEDNGFYVYSYGQLANGNDMPNYPISVN